MGYRQAVTTMRCAVLLAWCLSIRAADRSPDEVIKRVTERVVASAAHIPSYTCVETIVGNITGLRRRYCREPAQC